MEHQPYRLVFEGPADEKEETLRNLKATFIAELDYSISEVQEALLNAPVTLRSADGEEELEHCYQALKGAGASVLIVRPESEDVELEPEEEQSDEIAASDTVQESPSEKEEDSEDDLIFELEVDDLLEEPSPEKKQPKNTTYSLDFNPDDATALQEEMSSSNSNGISPSETITEDSELSFETEDVEPPLVAEEKSEEPAETVEEPELDLSFDEPDITNEDEEDKDFLPETEEVLPDSDQESDDELSLSFEDTTPDPEAHEEPVAEKTTYEDLSVPDEPLFAFDEDSEEQKVDKEEAKGSEQDTEVDLSIPDEPLFAFDEEDTHTEKLEEQDTAPAEPEHAVQEEPTSSLLFEEEEEQGEDEESLEAASELHPAEGIEDSSDESHVDEEQILEALGSIDQAFEDSIREESEIPETETSTSEPIAANDVTEEAPLTVEEKDTEEPHYADTPPAPKANNSSQAHNPLAIVLLVIIFSASAFLIYLNFLRDPAQNGLTEEAIAKAIQSSALAAKKQLKEEKVAEKKAKEQAAKAQNLTFRKLESHVESEQIDTAWSLTARGPRIISGSMKIETPKPPELTPEEIVRGTQERVWLRKVDLFSLNFSSTDGKTYTESTQARAYIEQGELRRRVVAHADITLEFDPEKDLLTGAIELKYPEDLSEKTGPLSLERTKGKFELYLKYEFSGTAGGKVPEE